MQEKCYGIIGASIHRWDDGLPDEEYAHAKDCPMCAGFLKVEYGKSPEQLNALWRSKAPERDAWERFRANCRAWEKTWRGWIWLYFGGPSWSRRAKWLGIPQRENHKPKEQ